jgi:hypothetical protein
MAKGRPKPPKKPPEWQEHVDAMSPWSAMVLAPALQPWVLIGAGAATVVAAKLSSWQSFLAPFGYGLLASSSCLAMELYAVPGAGLGTRADRLGRPHESAEIMVPERVAGPGPGA